MNPVLAAGRRKRLSRLDFSIISNNCWAGSVYRRYGLPYASPTVGLYFFASDYIRFISNLYHYINSELIFIDPVESKHFDRLSENHELDCPVGRLDDIEVVFLHYSSKEEASLKWKRRCNRINWDNIFIKFSQMNDCSDDDLHAFDAIPFKNKVCFTASRRPEMISSVYYPGFSENEGVLNDTDYYARYLNIDKWLNSIPVKYNL